MNYFSYLCTWLSPDGGIGRRSGLKHPEGILCRSDPSSGYVSRQMVKKRLSACSAKEDALEFHK